jgi:predicted TIM-barrel fold metal-dependent hydrolase
MRLLHFTAVLLLSSSTNALPTSSHDGNSKAPYLPPYLIALEEHTVSPSLEAELLSSSIAVNTPKVIPLLQDRPPVRLTAMDAAHISLTVLSQSSGTGVNNASACHAANIAMASLVAAKPDRYAGFAILPMGNPVAAAAELRFATQELKLVGAMIWNHLHPPCSSVRRRRQIAFHRQLRRLDGWKARHQFFRLARRRRKPCPSSLRRGRIQALAQAQDRDWTQWRRPRNVHRSRRQHGSWCGEICRSDVR